MKIKEMEEKYTAVYHLLYADGSDTKIK